MSGASSQLALDIDKQSTIRGKVLLLMLDHEFHSLEELERRCGGTVASVSARVRDLRKQKFGGYSVERVRVGTTGLYMYRIKQEDR